MPVVTNARTFAKHVFQLAEGMHLSAGTLTAEIGEAIGAALVLGTPRGGPPASPNDPHPGLAKANWVASVGAPDFSWRSHTRTENDAIAAIQVMAHRHVRFFVDAEIPFIIANGGDKVPYLGLLNDGSSRQAPAGFVKRAVLVGVVVAQQARLLARGASVKIRGLGRLR